jgi:hypothetical protein
VQAKRDVRVSDVRASVGKTKIGAKSLETPQKDDRENVVQANVGLHNH